MTEKKTLEIVSGTHYDQDTDTVYKEGKTVELPAVLLELFPRSFEEAEESSSNVAESEANGDDEFDAAEFVDRTPWSTVAKDIKSGAFDDRLGQIAEAERDGRDRKKLMEIIESRREQVDV